MCGEGTGDEGFAPDEKCSKYLLLLEVYALAELLPSAVDTDRAAMEAVVVVAVVGDEGSDGGGNGNMMELDGMFSS